MLMKKLTAAASALAIGAGMAVYAPASVGDADAASAYNYGEALQKSMFFYEVQQAGKLPDWNYVQWRDDSMVDEDGNETDVCTGGWFDAGDHFKFTVTNAYTASVLAWGYLEYKDAVDKIGMGETYRNNVQWGLDYLMQCDRGDKIIGTIGDFSGGSTDHNIWCSPEVYLRKHHLNGGDWERPYDEIADSTSMGLAAAALAEGYLMFKDTDSAKAKAYLEQAEKYFKSADAIRDNEKGEYGSMYPVSSWVDDCMYAACWLYKATGDSKYLDIIENDYIPQFPKENQSTENKYTWGFCWDDTTQGAALLYAQITGKQEWIDHISRHLKYWMNEDSKSFSAGYTKDGLAYLMNWGPLRHAANTAWIAFLACDTIFKDDAALCEKYNTWAKSQMDYCFGDNSMGMSYVLGMGDKNPTAIHHRAASGIHDDHWNELGKADSSEGWQTEYAHTLYGALIGGPDSSGNYDQSTIGVSNYEYTEVAIDYNAGYTAALCAMVADHGGTIDPSFPPTETPKWAEWNITSSLNGSSASYTEVKAWVKNYTAWPARVAKDIKYRYYFDASEILAGGLSIDDVTVEGKAQDYTAGEPGYATVTGPYLYDGTIYYAEIAIEDGRVIQPTGQKEHRDEVQFRISIPDAIDGKSTAGCWDQTNDWSAEGLEANADLKSDDALNPHITMYVDGKLVWGTEPDGTTPSGSDYTFTRSGGSDEPTPQPTTSPVKPTTQPGTDAEDDLWGDANVDGKVDLQDAVAILQSVALPAKYPLTEKGARLADVDGVEGISGPDALVIQQYDAHLVTKLPIQK
ncbi:MAG: glycoside hydrolase family 9 protein [Ruminococcus sp.]|nr:glycoside hydrolase family 9 protein [Ruminococcus sp.]